MHALLLTVLTIAAQPGTPFTPAAHTSEIAPVQYTDGGCSTGGGYTTGSYSSDGYMYGGDYGGGGYNQGGMFGAMRAKKGPMPQTCYAPRYGCYPGNDRYVHRYPAFHDSYYRRPYAYRHGFEYPWHAELHEPTSLWSYNVPLEQDPYFEQDQVPLPPVGARPGQLPQDSGVRSARRLPEQVSPRETEAPRQLQQDTRGARVMQQGLSEELPPIVVTMPSSRDSGPQPTPAVRPAQLAPVVPMSEAATQIARESFEGGANSHTVGDAVVR